ncbi:MAG TPA: PhoU domain-containing protein [Acidimicrobiales bacterium]|nr:PhoU domain-containing protein [Acidimicrobiales bacterium]
MTVSNSNLGTVHDTVQQQSTIDLGVTRLFALVSEALAGATMALLGDERETAESIVEADLVIDDLTSEIEGLVWQRIETTDPQIMELRQLINVLLILPELERSADLAEHIAQRARFNIGPAMSPRSRGIFQRMSEIAIAMWHEAADAYLDRDLDATEVDLADEELDTLRDQLTEEVAKSTMPMNISSQVILVARFYERLGDHAVNLARRIASLPPRSL